MTENDLDPTLQKILLAVHNAMLRSSNGWVRFGDIAKAVFGAWHYESTVRGYVELPQGAPYFRTSAKALTLTEAGVARVLHTTTSVEAHSPAEARLQSAVRAVRGYAGRLPPQRLKVQKVLDLASAGRRHVHAVHVEIEDSAVPADAPVTLYQHDGTAPVRGRVVGQEADGLVLYVAFESRVYVGRDSDAYLMIDRGFLLAQLAEALERMGRIPDMGWAIWRQRTQDEVIAHQDSVRVGRQLLDLPTPWTRFLWGPPGAGKTYGLCHFVVQLLEREPTARILLVAPANLAVDVATLQLLNQLEASPVAGLIPARQVLRFGYPRKGELLERPELLGPLAQDALTREVKRRAERVRDAEAARASDGALAVLRAELLEVQEQLKAAVADHVSGCRVVLTTTTLAYLPRSPVAQSRWTTVLVDEVTMVPPAICIYLSALASDRLLFAGDPRQLGPVYEAHPGATDNERDFLGRDLFDLSALTTTTGRRHEIALQDGRLIRITSQRRCTRRIWDQVAWLYPAVEHRVEETRVQALLQLPPARGEALVLLDTGAHQPSPARCQALHRSWRNTYSAELALEVASAITADAPAGTISVAIITPYRAQVGLLRKWLREETRAGSTLFRTVEVGTVHQFQGSEADVVIFDLVDGRGRERMGQLLRGDTGMRLVNVALTRARGKVIVIADRRWFVTIPQHEADNVLLWSLFKGTTLPRRAVRVAVAPPVEALEGLVESPIELMLLQAMRRYPDLSDVTAQHVIRDEQGKIVSRADFAFPSQQFAVYCDGAQWHLKADRWQRDLRQRNKLQTLGWRFLVFSGHDIHQDADACAAQVAQMRRTFT